jgi:hypothetical protein
MVTGNGSLVINADPAFPTVNSLVRQPGMGTTTTLPGSLAKTQAPTSSSVSEFLTWLAPATPTVSPMSINSDRAMTLSMDALRADELLSAGSTLDRRLTTALVSPRESSSQLGAIDRLFSDPTLGSIGDEMRSGISSSV